MENKYINEVDELISLALKGKQEFHLKIYRLLKAKLLEFITAKNAKSLDETSYYNIIRKMIKELEEESKMYYGAGRINESGECEAQMVILSLLVPSEPTEEDVNDVLDRYNGEFVMKNMGNIIKYVKETLPMADGKIISTLVKNRM